MIDKLLTDLNKEREEIILSGSITIDSHLKTVPGLLIKFNIINLYNINRITSIGVARWIDFFKEYFNSNPDKIKRIKLRKCASVIIEQYNFVPEFLSWFDIESLAVPFFCDECGKDVEKIFFLKELIQMEDLSTLNTVCFNCGNNCELSYASSDYFKFLNDNRNL